MIKAVIFDMGGPLLTKRPDYQPDVVVETAEALRAGSKDDHEFLLQLNENPATSNLNLDDILERIVNKYVKIAPVWSFLPELKEKNYKLAIVNNGTGLTLEKFKRKNDFSRYFDLFINSSEEGIEKPDLRIYLLVCERLGVKPDECVFIDDTEENVRTAEELGMQGFLYKNNPDLLKNFLLDQISNPLLCR